MWEVQTGTTYIMVIENGEESFEDMASKLCNSILVISRPNIHKVFFFFFLRQKFSFCSFAPKKRYNYFEKMERFYSTAVVDTLHHRGSGNGS